MHADSRFTRWSWIVLLCAFRFVDGFYIPGWSIKSYVDHESIPLFVNKVYSDRTQLQYAYYDLPFVCPPSGRRHADSSLVSGHSISLNLGEVLRGDRIRNSDYALNMAQDQECHFLCRRELDRPGLNRARRLIADGYVAEWIVDNLPGATTFVTADKKRKYYAAGFKIGAVDHSPDTGQPRYLLNNHVSMVLRWRKAPGRAGESGRKVIVGFEVYPKSVGTVNRDANGCPERLHDIEEAFELHIPSNETRSGHGHSISSSSSWPRRLDDEDDDQGEVDDGRTIHIPYTYSVYFREDDTIEWANRWDLYFVNQEGRSTIRWLAILNSLVISGLLATVVAVILARTVRSDLRTYGGGGGGKDGLDEYDPLRLKVKKRLIRGRRSPRQLEKGTAGISSTTGSLLEGPHDDDRDADVSSDDDVDNDDDDDDDGLEDVTGWKLLHGDVFRPPPYGGLLAPLVGSGMQLVFMAGALLVLSCLGILNPSFRGGFVSFGVGLFVFASVFSGYFSGRIYHTFGGLNWRKNASMTALLFPGLLFGFIFVLNLFVWAQASSTAIPFGTVLALAALWLFIQVPLVYIGSWYGFVRVGPWDHPTKTHTIARPIPSVPWHGRSIVRLLLAGLLPFAVIFIELIFVFQSLWQDKSGYYYVFGFLAVVSVMLIITIVEVTVVATYFLLCDENHHWWWQSFLVGGGSAVWIFAYSVWYYSRKLHIQGFVSGMLFFAYSALACAVYGLLTGTIGFLTAYAFVRRIYGAIKAD